MIAAVAVFNAFPVLNKLLPRLLSICEQAK